MATGAVNNQATLQNILSSSAKSTSDRKVGQLGKDDFLNLLVTQLKNQDPLNPQDDKEFVGQMAQFSALEQMQNMSTSLTQSQAFSLIGKHVQGGIVDKTTFETKQVDGIATAVKISNGKTLVVIDDKELPIESITQVLQS